jgi:hypothetical protein
MCGRKDGDENGSNSRQGNVYELVDRRMVLPGEVEILDSMKEQKTFKEERKQSVRKVGLSKAMRTLIGRGMNWEDEREETE